MYGPISIYLLQATINRFYIELVENSTEDNINDLHYYTIPLNLGNVKTQASSQTRAELVSGYKDAIRHFINFKKTLNQAVEVISND